jgi:hypothetical protein
MSIKPIPPLPRDPRTPREWRAAADLAYTLLCLEDCKMYGLIEGGPPVDQRRCLEITFRAAQRGVTGKFNLELIRELTK